MNATLYFDDLQVGDSWTSRARTILESDVSNFAGLTGDYDPLHVDREFAKQTPFGRPIAHGLFGMSLVAGLGSHFPMVHTIAFVAVRNWEFLRPAYVGDTVHAVSTIVELTDAGRRRGNVVWHRRLVNQRGEIVQQGLFETIVAKKVAAAKSRQGTAAIPLPPIPEKPKVRRRSRAKEIAPSKDHST